MFRVHGLGFGFVCFYQVYCSTLHIWCALLSRCKWRTNKFSNMKVHWQTCSYYLIKTHHSRELRSYIQTLTHKQILKQWTSSYCKHSTPYRSIAL